jgi:hypothetical protein
MRKSANITTNANFKISKLKNRQICKMNKKGFLLGEETLKMVIAVICVIFLIFLLISIYFSKTNEVNRKHATAILEESDESIHKIISTLKEGESKSVNVFNPEGWYLFGFTGNELPNSCAGINCLCICDKLWATTFWNTQVQKCGEEGVCISVPELRRFDEIEIDEGLSVVNFQKIDGRILVSKV